VSWFIDFVVRLQDVKYLHYQFGPILHTGAFVRMTEVCLNRVVAYFQLSSYLVTIQTFKQQFEYLHLTICETVAHLHVNPFFLADQHSNIMNMSVTFVTFFRQGLTFMPLARFPLSHVHVFKSFKKRIRLPTVGVVIRLRSWYIELTNYQLSVPAMHDKTISFLGIIR
jgi:hypothetical protein